MKADCPEPYPSTWAAYREIIPALLRQLKDPEYYVVRELPVERQGLPARVRTARSSTPPRPS